MKKMKIKLMLSLILALGLSSNVFAQNNAPHADDYVIDISELDATEIVLNGTDADNDLMYFPIVRPPAHGDLIIGEVALITGGVEDLEAGPYSVEYWMFDQDASPFQEHGNLNSVYAYTNLNWNSDAHGDGTCDSEGSGLETLSLPLTEALDVVDGVADLYMFLDALEIASQVHVNTEDANDPWNTMGEAGEIRVYNNGFGGIKEDGVTKLAVDDMSLWLKIFYPSPVGAGGVNGYASGFGVASINQAASDPAWVAEFDPNGTGFIEIAFESFSQTVQNCYGAYDIVGMSIKPISDAVLSYTPDADFNGVDNFSYVIFDGLDFSDEVQVTLNVDTELAGITGTGTEIDPFQIETLDDLLWVSEHPDYWEHYYIQIADIDAAPTAAWNGGEGFAPIGNLGTSFEGHYDGQGHVIDGLTIARPGSDIQGLFGKLFSAEIADLGLTDVSIVGAGHVGGFVGLNSSSALVNIFTTGSVTGGNYVGGLVGYSAASTTLNCSSSCDVVGASSVGGFSGTSTSNDVISSSFAKGTVLGQDRVGGFTGAQPFSPGLIQNCYARGDVIRDDGASLNLGGFVGLVGPACAIENSFSTGSVSYTGADNPLDKGFAGTDNGGGVFTNNFYDSETSVQNTGLGATATITVDMKKYATFTLAFWDFERELLNGDDDFWDMDHVGGILNDGYPFLSWENGVDIAILPTTTPTALDLEITTAINQSVELALEGFDADDDELFYVIWDWATVGSLVQNGEMVTYTPPVDFSGDDSFSYQAFDGLEYSNFRTVAIEVMAPNTAPVLELIGDQETDEDTPMDVILVAADNEDDELTFTVVSSDDSVMVSLEGSTLTLTPGNNWNGTANIMVTVTDDGSGNLSDTETFVMTINPINDAPEAFALVIPADNINVMDSTLMFSWGVSSDIDSYGVFYTIRVFSDDYDLTIDAGTELFWINSVLDMPRATVLEWNVTASDSALSVISESRFFTVDESVGFVNTPPVAEDLDLDMLEDSSIDFYLPGSDFDNDDLTYAIIVDPSNGSYTLNVDHVVYQPAGDYSGLDYITYSVSDAEASDTGYVYIDIEAVNDAPDHFSLLTPGENENILGTEMTFTWEEAIDVDSDSVYYTVTIIGNGYVTTQPVGTDLFLTLPTLDMPRDSRIDWMVEATDSLETTATAMHSYTVDPAVGIDARELLPEAWALEQNYPNPFNPSTTISFSVPNTSAVRLTVYDVSGREITRLVDGVKTQGNYSVVWNGTDLSQNAVSSGMYFFRLEGEGFAQIKRMLYLK